MKAYLMPKELWYYVNGETKQPLCIDTPIQPVPESGSTTVAASATTAYKAALKTYNEQRDVQIVWDRADNKALGIIQLRMADKLQYLVKDTSLESWDNIKSQFDVSGPAAIFVDFKYVINFKFDERKEPSVQVAELNTCLNHLATHGFSLDNRIQAMIILSGLPQSWDSVQGSILANHNMAELNISVIMPILQEEWQRHQARHGDHKSSHLARGGIRGAPQRQPWQGNQNNSGYTPQAGPSNYNSSYKPAPYNKFGKKPNYKPNNQNPGYCYNTVQTPTLCKPDTSDRPLLFLSFNLLNLATPLLSYAVRLVLLTFVLLSSLPCYLYDAILILTSDILYSLIDTFLSILRYINTHVFVVEL
jgi:hypothetical protein